MAVVMLVLIGVAGFHFVYDGIIAPYLRYKTRLELFALRDELRWLAITGAKGGSGEAFEEIQASLNSAIRLCPDLSLSLLRKLIAEIRENAELASDVEQRVDALKRAEEPARRIWERSTRCVRRSLIINAGGWGILVLPMAPALAMLTRVGGWITQLVALPEALIKQVVDREGKPKGVAA